MGTSGYPHQPFQKIHVLHWVVCWPPASPVCQALTVKAPAPHWEGHIGVLHANQAHLPAVQAAASVWNALPIPMLPNKAQLYAHYVALEIIQWCLVPIPLFNV